MNTIFKRYTNADLKILEFLGLRMRHFQFIILNKHEYIGRLSNLHQCNFNTSARLPLKQCQRKEFVIQNQEYLQHSCQYLVVFSSLTSVLCYTKIIVIIPKEHDELVTIQFISIFLVLVGIFVFVFREHKPSVASRRLLLLFCVITTE